MALYAKGPNDHQHGKNSSTTTKPPGRGALPNSVGSALRLIKRERKRWFAPTLLLCRSAPPSARAPYDQCVHDCHTARRPLASSEALHVVPCCTARRSCHLGEIWSPEDSPRCNCSYYWSEVLEVWVFVHGGLCRHGCVAGCACGSHRVHHRSPVHAGLSVS